VSVHDDDLLDFDFVDDATVEAQPRDRGGAPPPGDGRPPSGDEPRGPRLPSTHGVAPLLRLVGVVAFAIVIAVLLVIWGQGCSNDRKQDAYADFTADMGAVGSASAKLGKNLATLITTPGIKEAELETKLGGLVSQQQQGIARAEAVDTPGPLRPAHEKAIQALQFRASGVQGLLETFRATATSKDASAAGRLLAAQATRLQASDVVWADLFKAPMEATMKEQGVTGLAAPASVFVENPDLYSARSMASIWTRVHGASTGGTPSGLHGTGLGPVTVQPEGVELSTGTETTIIVSTELAFDVEVTNTGDFQEVGIEVKLTIPKQPSPIVKTQKIDVIDQGDTATVTFRDFAGVPFDKTTVQISVAPVPGEENTGNNTAEFPVIFSLEP
jgi:hypothetical protein